MFQPTTFGKYFLTRRIAVGGMAEVFAAKLYGADGFEKDLVIKQILPQYARDPEFVQSFVAEAKIAVSLNHANVVGIYELGRVDGTYFIAMEFVDGLDVFQLLDHARKFGRTLNPGLALLVAEEVSKGLDYAHRKHGPDGEPLGLVHRDLNPRNVLISREGEVKILDFGIAKTASAAAAMPKTRAGVVKGTTGYMSPEQAVGLDVDPRTDIYQTGLLLFEMLTGEALFWRPDDETTRSLMRAHNVPDPSERNPSVAPEISELVLRLLSKSPERRVETAADLAQQLARLRFLFHPDEDHRKLGKLATELLELRRQEETQTELPPISVPSTLELSDVISKAIEHSITDDIETIATRFPSSPDATPGSTPLLVKSDSSVEETPALGTSQPPVHTRITRDETASAPSRVPTPPPSSTMSPWAGVEAPVAPMSYTSTPGEAPPTRRPFLPLVVGAVAATVVVLAAIGFSDGPDTETLPTTATAEVQAPEPAEDETAPSSTPTAPPDESASTETVSVAAEVGALPTSAKAPTSREAPPTPPKEATVAFGTRSCSSRVTVDGVVIARSTPSYDHRLRPGRHRISIEGTSCPPIERPGSLRRATPVVVKDVDVPAGAKLKVIADFERDRLEVRGN
ncbi:MAG: protein kinase [Myxococcota bacterium]